MKVARPRARPARAAAGGGGRVRRVPHLPRVDQVAPVGRRDAGHPRPRPRADGARRRPLRPGEDQGADPRVPGRREAQEGHEGADPLLRRPAGHRQDLAGQEHRQGPGPRVRRGSAWAACTTRPRSAATAAPTSPPCPAGSSRGSARPAPTTRCFMLDEVDKLGADFRGDPSPRAPGSPRPRAELDVPRPLPRRVVRPVEGACSSPRRTCSRRSRPPLLDRMEVLQLPGYSEEEKTQIAEKYIIPKQLDGHGLTPKDADDHRRRAAAGSSPTTPARPACANLEREIAAICRKVARKHAEGERKTPAIAPSGADRPARPAALLPRGGRPDRHAGVATGLAWTPTGGEILFIEATGMPGKGGLTLTGLLGESMRESRQAAMSYLADATPARARHRPGAVPARPTSTSTSRPARSPRTAPRPASRSRRRSPRSYAGRRRRPRHDRRGHAHRARGRRRPREDPRRARRHQERVTLPRENESDLGELPPDASADRVLHSRPTRSRTCSPRPSTASGGRCARAAGSARSTSRPLGRLSPALVAGGAAAREPYYFASGRCASQAGSRGSGRAEREAREEVRAGGVGGRRAAPDTWYSFLASSTKAISSVVPDRYSIA